MRTVKLLEHKISARQQSQELILQQPCMMQGSIRSGAYNPEYQKQSLQVACAN